MESYVQPDSLNMGLTLETGFGRDPMLGGRSRAFVVTWIRWDSGFRDSGLAVGDRLLAINGKRLEEKDFEEWRKRTGQNQEGAYWKSQGASDGGKTMLTVSRRVRPGQGWKEVEIQGQLRLQTIYRNDKNHDCFGPDGPSQRDYDGFSEGWGPWNEAIVKDWSRLLDDGWLLTSFGSEYELKKFLEQEARVNKLGELYPGTYSKMVRSDFEQVKALLVGREYSVGPEVLEFRTRAERAKIDVAEAGKKARESFLAAHAAEILPNLPQLDPILDDRSAITGKLVQMPRATNREWISQGTTTYFIFNQGNAWFFADAQAPSVQSILEARLRYTKDVDADVRAEFNFIARIEDIPALVVVNERGRFGLRVDPVAATIGDNAFFVEAQQPMYVGEEAQRGKRPAPPPDDATPEAVLNALIASVKEGDRPLYRALHSSFDICFLDNGLPRINTGILFTEGLEWEDARRKVMELVCDVRIVWTDEVEDLVKGTEFSGAPRIQQTFIEVDHLKQLPDGTFRSFMKMGLAPIWKLQRIGEGPWRIVTRNQGI